MRIDSNRQLAGVGLVLFAVTLVVLSTLGVVRPGGFIALASLNYPIAFGCIAALLGAAGLALLSSHTWQTWLLVGGGLVVALAWGLLGVAMHWLAGPTVTQTTPSPNQRYAVVVERTQGLVDPYWHVSIRQSSGLFAREWEIGCVNGDDPANELRRARWPSDEELVLTLWGGAALRVPVDADSGEPSRPDDFALPGC